MANEIQKYTFSVVPTSGSWRPVWNGNASGGSMTEVSVASDLAAYLAQIPGIDDQTNVSVSGNYASGFTVEFVGSLANTDVATLSHQDNTLSVAGTATFGTTQDGGGGNNEIQTIDIDADGGTYSISIPGYGTTSALNWNDDASTIATALSSLISGGALVTGSGFFPNFSFDFGGGVADTDIPQMAIGTNSLTKAVTISVSVLQEGSPASGPTVSLTASTTSIAENGGTAALIASLSATASDTVTVVVSTSGTATSGSDYSLSTTTITIASGQTSGSVSAVSINDGVYEGNETFTASITSVTGGGASSSATSQAAFTIVDDETQPSVSMSASAVAIAENGGTATVVATLSNLSVQNVTVGFGFSGTATLNTDYSASTNSIIIAAGNTSGSISITAINDAIYDPGETVIVGIDSVTNGTENGNQSVSITITDDEVAPVVNLSASTTSISENLATSYVVARLDKFSALATTINFGFSGSATLNTDYSASSNSLVVAAGQTSGSISVTAIQDSTWEVDETINVGITSVTNGTTGSTTSVSITLVDDDPPLVSLLLLGSPIAENGGVATVAGLLSETHSADVTVNLAFTGTATTTSDYTATSTSFKILSGQTSGSITITAVNDASAEGHETVVVDISSVTNGTENGTQQVTLTILDDETKPSVGFQVSSATVSESASTYNVVCVLTNPFTQSGNITVLLGGGTATQLEDYSGSFALGSVTMSFAVGSTSASSSVSIVNDNKWEPDETLPLSFNTASFVPFGVFNVGPISTSTVTITNDDPAPTLSISASQTTMSENAGTAKIFAFLTNPLQLSSIVYLNYGGSATRNVDYTRSAASPVAIESMGQTLLVISAGQTSASITLLGIDDAAFESNETIIVSIASISYGDYNQPATPILTGATAATVSIVSDDTSSGSGLLGLKGLSGLSGII